MTNCASVPISPPYEVELTHAREDRGQLAEVPISEGMETQHCEVNLLIQMPRNKLQSSRCEGSC